VITLHCAYAGQWLPEATTDGFGLGRATFWYRAFGGVIRATVVTRKKIGQVRKPLGKKRLKSLSSNQI